MTVLDVKIHAPQVALPIRDLPIFQLTPGDRYNFSLVEVDVAKVDRAWKPICDSYIDRDGRGANEGRLEKFENWLSENPGKPIWAPRVYLTDERNWVHFDDGRHRFAVLRNRGYHTVKLAVRRNQLDQFRNVFGPEHNHPHPAGKTTSHTRRVRRGPNRNSRKN
jgi:hypothetical protein